MVHDACGNDAVLRRIEQPVVDAHDDVECSGFLDRRANHDAFHALLQISLQNRNGFHLAAGFDHQVAVGPIGVGDGLVRGHPDPLALDHQAIAVAARFVLPAAMHRVEVQQVGMGSGVAGRIVDPNELQLRPAPGGAKRQTSNAAKTIDAYFHSHKRPLPNSRFNWRVAQT